jgi:hypothetical protein
MAGFLFGDAAHALPSEKMREFFRQTTSEVIDILINLLHISPRGEQQEVRHDAP